MKCCIDGCDNQRYEYKRLGAISCKTRCKKHFAEYHNNWQKKNKIARNIIVQRYRDKKRAEGLPYK